MSVYPPNNACGPLPQVLCFHVEASADSLHDLSLRVVPAPSHGSTPSSSAHHMSTPSPRWIRKRALSSNDEIVEQLYDTVQRQVSWTTHRPVRGWYVHLCSPAFPPGSAWPIQPIQKEDNTTGTPLSLSIRTRINQAYMSKLYKSIDEAKDATHHLQTHEHFTTVMLGDTGSNQEAPLPAHTTARPPRMTANHARRRSAGLSVSAHSRQASMGTNSERIFASSANQIGSHIPSQPPSCGSQPSHCTLLITEQDARQDADTSSPSWSTWMRKSVESNTFVQTLRTRGNQFSIWWTDAPLPGSTGQDRPVEVLRFEDVSSFWTFRKGLRGQISLQQAAVAALNIDIGVYMAVRTTIVHAISLISLLDRTVLHGFPRRTQCMWNKACFVTYLHAHH